MRPFGPGALEGYQLKGVEMSYKRQSISAQAERKRANLMTYKNVGISEEGALHKEGGSIRSSRDSGKEGAEHSKIVLCESLVHLAREILVGIRKKGECAIRSAL